MQKRKIKLKILSRKIKLVLCFSLIQLLPMSDSWGQGIFFSESESQTPCLIDFEDFIAFAGSFGSNVGDENFNPVVDFNDDGTVSFPDFLVFVGFFGTESVVGPSAKIQQEDLTKIEAQVVINVLGRSDISVSFSKQIRITNPSGLTLTSSFIDLENGDIGERSFGLQNIVLNEDRMRFVAESKGVLADGGRFSLDGSCYQGDIWVYNAYEVVSGEAVLSSPYSPADVTLSLRPFSPTDVNQFTPGVYFEASEMVPASGDTLTEVTARVALEAFLMARYANADSVQLGLDLYDDAILVSKIANPTLRAGLVSLKGTMAEDAITAIQRGPFGPITFGEVTSGDYAEVKSGGIVVVDERYQPEAFALFGPVFARVGLQSDTQTGEAEEITGSAILALVAMEQVVVDSSLAQLGTELSRRLNTQMFGRLNSGQASFPGIGIYQTPEGEAFPGGRSFVSYAAVFEPLDDVETPATSLLGRYLERLAPAGTDLPSVGSFNAEVLAFLDRYQDVLSAGELVRVARALKLKE